MTDTEAFDDIPTASLLRLRDRYSRQGLPALLEHAEAVLADRQEQGETS